MQLRELTIERFRGIEQCKWRPTSAVACLIVPATPPRRRFSMRSALTRNTDDLKEVNRVLRRPNARLGTQ